MSSSRILRWRSRDGALRGGGAGVFAAFRAAAGALGAGRAALLAGLAGGRAAFGVRATVRFTATVLGAFLTAFLADFAAGLVAFLPRPGAFFVLPAVLAEAAVLADVLRPFLAPAPPARLAAFRPAAAPGRRAGVFVTVRAAFRLAIALILSTKEPDRGPGAKRTLEPRDVERRISLFTLTVTVK